MLQPILGFLTERISGMLEPADREALCGDIAESGVSELAALRDVMSLVVRRKAAALRNFRPGALLALLGAPLGLLLSIVSRRMADGSAIYLWLYTGNWNLRLAQMPGYWRGMADSLPNVLIPFAVLACTSLATGLLIGTVARETRWLSSGGLISVLLCVEILGAPHGLGFILTLGRARDYFGNAAAFGNVFYRTVYPQFLVLFLSVLPFAYGSKNGIHVRRLAPSDRLLVSVAFAASLGTLACQSFSWWVLHLWDKWPLQSPGLPSPIATAAFTSATYLYLIATHTRNVMETRA